MTVRLAAWTRPAGDGGDPIGVTHAMHLSLEEDGRGSVVLASGSAVWSGLSVPGPDGRQRARVLREPALARAAGIVLAVAVPLDADGSELPGDRVVLSRSTDLRCFEDAVAVELGSAAGVRRPSLRARSGALVLSWTTTSGDPRSAVVRDGSGPHRGVEDLRAVRDGEPEALVLTDEEAERLRREAVPLHHVRTVVDAAAGRATLGYSDGSIRTVPLDADGTVRRPALPFPLADGHADPQVFEHGGRWYLLATDDRTGDNQRVASFLLREAASIEALAHAEDVAVLAPGPAGMAGCFWAPEAHVMGGRLRILFAPSIGRASWDAVECHVMTLVEGGSVTEPADWTTPVPVRRRDGRPLVEDGISLDMTTFAVDGQEYLVWSQRSVGAVLGDAELWIATVDGRCPERLVSDPVRLHTARLSWEVVDEANVAEGPFALLVGDAVHLAYAAGPVGPHYATGLLSSTRDRDLLDPASWTRLPHPLLDSRSVPGQRGPGHVSFVRAGDEVLVAFHAKRDPLEPARHTGVRRVHLPPSGLPVLTLTPERDVDPTAPVLRA